jgi:molybdate-binding protein
MSDKDKKVWTSRDDWNDFVAKCTLEEQRIIASADLLRNKTRTLIRQKKSGVRELIFESLQRDTNAALNTIREYLKQGQEPQKDPK